MADQETAETMVQGALRALRERGWTMDALAEELGVSAHAMYGWAKGNPVVLEKVVLIVLALLSHRSPPPRGRPGRRPT